MSVTILQDKIRKIKNPAMINFDLLYEDLPAHLTAEEVSTAKAYGRFCRELLSGLKGIVPAVRFNWSHFSILGSEGMEELHLCLEAASKEGYYVVLDAPELLSSQAAELAAREIFGRADTQWKCDALVISSYLGSDVVKPFLPYCKKEKKDLFLVVRTSNKSAAEMQDLMTGNRLVHLAAADLVARSGVELKEKCGYMQVGAVGAAGAALSLKSLRSKYPAMFILVDGMDYPNGNAKNCSYAFDQFGHGAVACAGTSVTCAWKQTESDGQDFVEAAVKAAERVRRNLTRYVTVM